MTYLKVGVLLVLSLAPLFGGGDPAHGASPKSALDMGILLSTPITHVDTDGDGKVDLVREFDGNGVLQRLEWSSPDSGRSWMQIWYRKSRGSDVERVLEFRRKGTVTTLSKDIIGARGERLSRERTYYHQGSPSRMERDIFLNEVRLVQNYRFESGSWVADGDAKKHSAVLELSEHGEALAKEYTGCGVLGSGWWKEDPCEQANASLVRNLGIITPDAVRYMTECSYFEKIGGVYREWVLRTPQGLEIDLSSCGTAAAVEAIKKSAQSLEQSLSCLYSVAPSFAMGAYLGIAGCDQDKALRIHCGNSANPDNWYGLGCGQLRGEPCSGDEGHGDSGAAYSAGMKSVVITGYDPTVVPVRSQSDQERLDSSLFHEILHNAEAHDGMHGDPAHNDQRASVGRPEDWIYACQSLCSPSRDRFSYISRERCLTCAGVGDGDLGACESLPPEAVVGRIKVISSMDRCLEGLKNKFSPGGLLTVCTGLHDTPALPDGTLEYRNGARSIYDACIIDLAKAGRSDQEQIECIQEAKKKHQQGIAKEVFSSKDARQWMGNLSVYRLDEEGRPSFEGRLDVERKEELRILIEAGAASLCRGEQSSPDAQLVVKLESEAARIGLSAEDPNVSKLLGVLKSTSASARTTACRGLRR